MIKRVHLFVFSCLLPLLLSSCAQYYIQTGQLDSQLESWQTEHQYQAAISAIDQLPSDHPNYHDYQSQRDQLLKNQQRFIDKTINQANQLLGKRQWHDAILLYQQAIAGNPNQPQLIAAYKNSQSQLLIYTTKLQHQLNLTDASVLRKRLQLITELQRSNPDEPDFQLQLAAVTERQQELHDFLTECARNGVQYPNFSHGEKCLLWARETLPTGTSDKDLVALEKHYKQQHKQSSNARDRKVQQKISALEQQYHEALKEQDYLLSRELLDQQDLLLPSNTHLITTRLELDAEIEAYVQQQIKLGADAYSNGNINKALEIWHPLLPLSPDNLMLLGHIQRAESFANKVKSLQNTQQDNPESLR